MFFRNLTLFRFSPEAAADVVQHIDGALNDHALFPPNTAGPCIGPLEMQRSGFVPPIGDFGAPLSYQQDRYIAFCVATDARLLPAAVVNDELRRRIDKVMEDEGRRVGGRERRRIKENLLVELMPQAFVRRTVTHAYVDTEHGWLVIDTVGRSRAELVVTQLREALGSFPALPLAPETFTRGLLTAWLGDGEVNNQLPDDIHLGYDVELIDPTASTAKLIGRNVDLAGNDIMEAVRGGSVVSRLGLNYADRCTFVLGEDLVVRRFQLTDIATDALDDSFDSSQEESQATFALLTGEVDKLLFMLATQFKLPRPHEDDPLRLDREDAPAPMIKADRALRKTAADVQRTAPQVKSPKPSRCAADILGYHVSAPTHRPIPHCPQPDQGNTGEVEA